jgi:hypothetical protein
VRAAGIGVQHVLPLKTSASLGKAASRIENLTLFRLDEEVDTGVPKIEGTEPTTAAPVTNTRKNGRGVS